MSKQQRAAGEGEGGSKMSETSSHSADDQLLAAAKFAAWVLDATIEHESLGEVALEDCEQALSQLREAVAKAEEETNEMPSENVSDPAPALVRGLERAKEEWLQAVSVGDTAAAATALEDAETCFAALRAAIKGLTGGV